MASARPQVGRASVAENVIKQGYLKKSVRSSDPLPSATKQIATNIKQKLEPSRWYVFGVRFGTPYLEYFESEEKVFTNRPLEIHDLSTYRNLTYTLGKTNTNYTFCIFLEYSTIELTAQNRAQMLDWCRSLERHLRNLGIGNKKAKEDHTYAPFPVAHRPTRSSSFEEELERQGLEGLEGATGLDIEDDTPDPEDNIYVEADDVKQLRKDENDNNRSSPPLPPRPRKSDEDESVFASISSIQKLPDNDYNNCGGATAGILEEELYDDCSEGGLAVRLSEGSQDQSASALNRNTWERFNEGVNNGEEEDLGDEEDDRCASMPIIPVKEVPESDTSEDSDFIAASFWLRNRKQEDLISFDDGDIETVQLRHAPGYSGNNAPLLPTRAQSVRVDSRRCVSLYSAAQDLEVDGSLLLTPTMNPKPVPKPRKSPVLNHEDTQKSDLSKNGGKTQNQSDGTFVKDVCKINHSRPFDELDGRVPTDADDDGSYEALFEATQGRKAPEPVAEEIYETTWGGASGGDRGGGGLMNRGGGGLMDRGGATSSNTPITPTRGDRGSASGSNRGSASMNDSVLGEGQCNPEYEPVEVVEGKTEFIKDQPKEVDNSLVAPKRKGITKLFSRMSTSKDKDKSIPDALFVSLPPRNRDSGSSKCAKKGTCESPEEEEEAPAEGNLYTDFPEDQMSKSASSAEGGGAKSKVVDYYSVPKKASPVDDLKSKGNKQPSPVLPRRNLAASVGGGSRQVPAEYTLVQKNLSKSCSETRSFNFDKPCNEEVYEDVCNGDISGSSNSPVSDKSQALLYDCPYDSGPVAPPRRNKPTASVAPVSYRFEQGQHKTVISNNKPTSYEHAETLPIGEKPVFTNFTDEPPLPPRIDSLPPKSGTSSPSKSGSLEKAPAPPAITSLPERSGPTKNGLPERPPPPRPARNSPTERPPLPSPPTERPAMPLPRDDGPPTSQAPPPPVMRRGMARSQSDDVPEPRPPAARPKTSYGLNRQPSQSGMNLKQNQVDVLRSERDSTGGMVRQIPKAHFQNGLALVQCFERIWIAGWDVKKYPRLYDKFHIGDELISVNDVQLVDLPFAYKLVKNIKADHIEVTVRRLPMARIFAIQRAAEGESLGIKREGGTSEIVYVDPHGLASRFGLSAKASTMSGGGLCNWCLTEINMRHLNLFFKDSEIEHRLLAVGRDISIIVQPSDFIKELKKQLKKIRGYKDYLIH